MFDQALLQTFTAKDQAFQDANAKQSTDQDLANSAAAVVQADIPVTQQAASDAVAAGKAVIAAMTDYIATLPAVPAPTVS